MRDGLTSLPSSTSPVASKTANERNFFLGQRASDVGCFPLHAVLLPRDHVCARRAQNGQTLGRFGTRTRVMRANFGRAETFKSGASPIPFWLCLKALIPHARAPMVSRGRFLLNSPHYNRVDGSSDGCPFDARALLALRVALSHPTGGWGEPRRRRRARRALARRVPTKAAITTPPQTATMPTTRRRRRRRRRRLRALSEREFRDKRPTKMLPRLLARESVLRLFSDGRQSHGPPDS